MKSAKKVLPISVMIVDDEDRIRNLLKHTLKDRVELVKCFSCGLDAIKDISSGFIYDAAIIDSSLPDVSGDIVSETYINYNPQGKIIRISGTNAPEVYRSGSLRFIAKPFTCEQIYSALEDYLK